MPFISPDLREIVDPGLAQLFEAIDKEVPSQVENAVLCYCIYKLVKMFKGNVLNNWETKSNGAKIFDQAKEAFQQFVIAPHEIKKREEYGDI